MTHAFHFLWESALFVCRVRATLKTPSTSNNNQKKSYMNKIQSKCNWRKRYSHHIKLSLILLAWSVACTRKLMGSLWSCTLQQITFVGIVNNMSYLTVAFKTAMKRKKRNKRNNRKKSGIYSGFMANMAVQYHWTRHSLLFPTSFHELHKENFHDSIDFWTITSVWIRGAVATGRHIWMYYIQ